MLKNKMEFSFQDDIEKITDKAVDRLRKVVSIPSVTFDEDNLCSYLFEELENLGCRPKRLKNNIVCGLILKEENVERPSKPTLVLDAHMDTVPLVGGYTLDPFKAPMDRACEAISKLRGENLAPGDVVYGLGSNDDGASLVSMIAVYSYFKDKVLPYNIALSLTCEEERNGSNGASWLYGEDSPLAFLPDFAIVGEPTGMKAATSERGLLVIDAKARGECGHAATGTGKNALYMAVEDIMRLRAYKFEKVSAHLGAVRLNVTQIEAGVAHNIVPDECTFVVDIRPNELYTNSEILDILSSFCRSELKARNLKNSSHATPKSSKLYECVKRMGLETYSSPTTSNWTKMPFCAIKMGPGESERSHKADEYVLKSEIEGAIRGYVEFIGQLASLG